ncbi:hypothetical protein QQI_0609, partial [Clostridioides difficile Y401]
ILTSENVGEVVTEDGYAKPEYDEVFKSLFTLNNDYDLLVNFINDILKDAPYANRNIKPFTQIKRIIKLKLIQQLITLVRKDLDLIFWLKMKNVTI